MRILGAEDDAPLADFLRQRLVLEQFAVQLASDGTEAQRLATNQTFDLVILDLNLPELEGWRSCETSALESRICQ
jgi:two-component system copper resistance phosphate regulon response regulator CusR